MSSRAEARRAGRDLSGSHHPAGWHRALHQRPGGRRSLAGLGPGSKYQVTILHGPRPAAGARPWPGLAPGRAVHRMRQDCYHAVTSQARARAPAPECHAGRCPVLCRHDAGRLYVGLLAGPRCPGGGHQRRGPPGTRAAVASVHGVGRGDAVRQPGRAAGLPAPVRAEDHPGAVHGPRDRTGGQAAGRPAGQPRPPGPPSRSSSAGPGRTRRTASAGSAGCCRT